MQTHGKKYRSASERRELGVPYAATKAIEIVKAMAFAKFDETVEVAIRLGVDPRHADQVVRGTVVLPAGTGKTMRVLVIAAGAKTHCRCGLQRGGRPTWPGYFQRQGELLQLPPRPLLD